jgi:tetratricopeptide (TPR) repeat protein
MLAAVGVGGLLMGGPAAYARMRQNFRHSRTSGADVRHATCELAGTGRGYVDLKRLSDAVTQFRLALPLFQETGDSQGEGYALNNLGDTYRLLGRPERVVEHLEQALTVQRGTGDEAGLQFTLSTLGDVHRDAGHHDLALERYQQALATSKELQDPRATARALANIATTLDDTAALTYWRRLWRSSISLATPRPTKSGPGSTATRPMARVAASGSRNCGNTNDPGRSAFPGPLLIASTWSQSGAGVRRHAGLP